MCQCIVVIVVLLARYYPLLVCTTTPLVSYYVCTPVLGMILVVENTENDCARARVQYSLKFQVVDPFLINSEGYNNLVAPRKLKGW